MQYVGILIEDLGEQSTNRRGDVTDTSGVQDNEILKYLTNAQRRLQSVILKNVGHTSFFDEQETISVVAGTRSYTLSGSLYYDQKVKLVRFSQSGLADDYYPLELLLGQRWTTTSEVATPEGYFVANGVLWLDGVPTTAGYLEVTYVRRLDKLEKRRGTIGNVSGTYTSITLDDDSYLDSDRIALFVGDYLCVTNAQGVVSYYNALISAYDSTTRVVTLSGATTTVGTISAGSYITLGKYTTTHSKLPDECEQYLTEFANWKLQKGDSSDDALEANQELVAIEDDIIGQFANAVDIQQVAVYDPYGDFA